MGHRICLSFGVHFAGSLPERSEELVRLHPRHELDCRVLAETEQAGHAVLLSFDFLFIKRLGKHARLRLDTPKAYWDSLVIPRGGQPNKVPAHGNPRAGETWWVW